VISTFYSLEREITFVVISDKGVVVLFAAGMELHSFCQDCLFILAVEVHFFISACCILAARCIFLYHISQLQFSSTFSFVRISFFPGETVDHAISPDLPHHC
jgi:hypothetical protein